MKILSTGDLHLGREYAKYERPLSERYRNARIEALQNAVNTANAEKCSCIVIAGDMYDRKTNIPVSLHKEVCGILADFDGAVYILPGNHDHYTDENDGLWNDFRRCSADNTLLLCEERPYETENAVFYPCICRDKRSEKNALDWVKEHTERSADKLNIGLAHGAIEGLSYDREQCYYYMTVRELKDCNMDLWLIGHTHVPYPDKSEVTGERIFNAGTHQQTDIADNSEGSVFIVDIDRQNVKARKVHTGVISFVEKSIAVSRGDSLEERISSALQGLDTENTTLRLNISGTALMEDYENRAEIYSKAEKNFLSLEIYDGGLRPEITAEMIDSATLEGSVENKLLKLYIGEPETLDLAFELVKRCREG